MHIQREGVGGGRVSCLWGTWGISVTSSRRQREGWVGGVGRESASEGGVGH